jgi:DNA-directed RNA polymerase subunit omega
MARITVEDCLKKGYNKFLLVHLAAKRVVQLRKGKEPLVECNNTEIVTVLREIEQDKVRMRPEGSPSEAFLEMEPELPAPTDDQVEPETAAEADEEMGAEAAAEADEQGEPKPTVESGDQGQPEPTAEADVEMKTEAQEEGKPEAESEARETEADVGEDKGESTSDKA